MRTNRKKTGPVLMIARKAKHGAALFLASILIIYMLYPTDDSMSDKLYELPQDCDFMAVGNNSGREYDCTPKLRDGLFSKFQGLVINGPAETVWPENVSLEDTMILPNGDSDGPLKLMVAGLLKLPANYLNMRGDFSNHVLLVAVNQKTAESYSGKMNVFGFSGESPPVSYGDFDVTEQYFNIDLVQNLGIPIANATYSVYATLGEYKSNVLMLKTRVE